MVCKVDHPDQLYVQGALHCQFRKEATPLAPFYGYPYISKA
ncbi:MAG: hypothetical protein ACI3XR_05000 [Eubacteriales bacterium]